MDTTKDAKNKLGNQLYKMQEEIDSLSMNLDSSKRDGDNYKSD